MIKIRYKASVGCIDKTPQDFFEGKVILIAFLVLAVFVHVCYVPSIFTVKFQIFVVLQSS